MRARSSFFFFKAFLMVVMGFCALPLLTLGNGFWSLPNGWKRQ